MLEGELKSELNFPWPSIAVKATKTSSGAPTEVRVIDIVIESQVCGLQANEIHAVKEIEDLGPELNAITFANSPILIYREVNVLAGWHSYNPAPQRAKGTCGG